MTIRTPVWIVISILDPPKLSETMELLSAVEKERDNLLEMNTNLSVKLSDLKARFHAIEEKQDVLILEILTLGGQIEKDCQREKDANNEISELKTRLSIVETERDELYRELGDLAIQVDGVFENVKKFYEQ